MFKSVCFWICRLTFIGRVGHLTLKVARFRCAILGTTKENLNFSMVLMECDTRCPRNSQCKNRRMSRRESAEKGLETFKTSNGRGLGVRTKVDVDKGQVSTSSLIKWIF